MSILQRALCALWLGYAATPLLLPSAVQAVSTRLKDIADFQGVRANDLVGYGLVVGLNGTGDSLQNSPYTQEALQNMLQRLGVNVTGENFRPKNVAAVMVTATLPAFARPGSRIDVTVSAVGDAKSLLGGTLIMTPLNAADGQVYAVAQGQLVSSGLSAEGQAGSVTKGVPTAASISGGARVERESGFELNKLTDLQLTLREPDFSTSNQIAQSINRALGRGSATMLDSGTVQLHVPQGMATAQMLAQIENLSVQPQRPAKVVVDQRSGTIVVGNEVRVSTVAVAQGSLTIKVMETPVVSQPSALSGGSTAVLPRTGININEDKEKKIAILNEGPTLADLVAGLNALGIGPRDMIDILSTIKAAGALHADLIVR